MSLEALAALRSDERTPELERRVGRIEEVLKTILGIEMEKRGVRVGP